MVGRALRPSPGKEHAIILDHVNAYHTHGSVADPYVWELEMTRKKRSREVDAELEEKEVKERIINADGSIQLVLIGEGESSDWVKKLQELISVMTKNNYKKGWVYHKFVTEYPQPTLEQLSVLAKALKYHWKWAERMYEALQNTPVDNSKKKELFAHDF
jgi:superfamily II DNA or RNA helicase